MQLLAVLTASVWLIRVAVCSCVQNNNMTACCDTKYQHISEADRRSLPGVVNGVGCERSGLYICICCSVLHLPLRGARPCTAQPTHAESTTTNTHTARCHQHGINMKDTRCTKASYFQRLLASCKIWFNLT